jgi:phosphoenolpyruvate carboxykinase (ATP)
MPSAFASRRRTSPKSGTPSALPLQPKVYANLLGDRLRKHKAQVWLVNTGWTGGPYGVGHRISIPYTRAMVRAALRGDLDGVEYRTDPIFGLHVPKVCPGVPPEILDPRQTWQNKEAYDEQARKLKAMWNEQMKKMEG